MIPISCFYIIPVVLWPNTKPTRSKVFGFVTDVMHLLDLLPIGSEEKGVLGVWSIPSAILPSCQYMKNSAL